MRSDENRNSPDSAPDGSPESSPQTGPDDSPESGPNGGGPCMDQAPDLVILSRHGCDLKGKVSVPGIFEKTDLQGMHTQDDAFFFSGSGTECDSIFEAKKAVMNSLAPALV